MDVSLTPELEQRIAVKVESGAYATASGLVREALKLLFSRDRLKDQTANLQARLDLVPARDDQVLAGWQIPDRVPPVTGSCIAGHRMESRL
jgi:putative addiction module CopG family antidote